jgi:hypothetical protein
VSVAAPSFDAGGPATVRFGDRVQRAISIADPDSTNWTATIDTGAGPEPVEVRGSRAFVDVYPSQIGLQNAVITVCDDGQKCTSHTLAVTVTANSAPYVTAAFDTSAPLTNELLTATASSSDPDGDPTTRRFVWTVNGQIVRDTGTTSATTNTLDLSQAGFGDVGHEIAVQITASDGQALSAPATATATVVSTPPAVTMPSASSVAAHATYSATGTAADVDGLTGVTGTVDYGDTSGTNALTIAANGGFGLSHVYNAAGSYQVTVTITDPQGKQAIGITTITVTAGAIAPTVDAGPDKTINEGQTFTSTGAYTNPAGGAITGHVNYGDGTATATLALSSGHFNLSHVYTDNGVRTVTVTVTDSHATTATDTATVTVNNVAPTITSITGPTAAVTKGSPATVKTTFTDPGSADTHTVRYAWGDGTTTAGSVTESHGSGGTSASHVYAVADVYAVTVTVTDDDLGASSATFQSVVVNDPKLRSAGVGGFASPAGANPSKPTQTGGATLTFTTSTTALGRPSGTAQFNYLTGLMTFTSTGCTALITTVNRVQAVFSGLLNGRSGYTLTLSAIDGDRRVPKSPDFVRVKITKNATGAVVYDSQPGAPVNALPTTRWALGQIAIF